MSAMPPIPTAAPMDSKLQRQLEWEWSAPQPVQAEQQPRAPSAAPYPDTAAPLFPTQMAQAHLNYSALSAPPPVQAQSPEWDQQSTARGPSVISDSASAFLSAFRNSAEDWTVQMVGDWLGKIGASEEIVKNFAEQEIDGSILATLTLDDLKSELGVSALGLRRKIMMGIEKLKGGQ
ncbi:SAM domain-containing protein [Chytriomyces sp. MP71]|nr:SAM domain-containing protein [Chytriomyces sp. MP71]